MRSGVVDRVHLDTHPIHNPLRVQLPRNQHPIKPHHPNPPLRSPTILHLKDLNKPPKLSPPEVPGAPPLPSFVDAMLSGSLQARDQIFQTRATGERGSNRGRQYSRSQWIGYRCGWIRRGRR